MRMNKDGLFKIMQITDMQEIPKISPDTMALLDAAIEDEKPDLVVYRKITFKADVNPTLSMILYAIMVVFTIFANGWIGSAMTTFAQSHNLTGNLWDLVIKLIGMTIPTLWTYPCNRFIIHRRKKSTIEAEMAAESLSAVEEA